MALAYALLKLKFNFALAHCNFQLRGKESDEDEAFVKNWGAENEVQVFSKTFETNAFAKQQKLNTQLAARELRYSFFAELLGRENYDYLATAHHLKDSLETLLINLGRGNGLKGLSGIPEVNQYIIRPMNEVSSAEIETFTKKFRINWREDSSNQKDDYQRNAIRHHVIPELEKAIPELEKKWETTFKHLKSDRDFLMGQLDSRHHEIVTHTNGQQVVSINRLLQIKGYPALLYHWLYEYGNFDLTAILASLRSESGQVFESGVYHLLKNRDQLILETKPGFEDNSFTINATQTMMSSPILLSFEKIAASDYELCSDKDIAAFDLDRLEFPLTLRKWRKGDRFHPLGLKHSKKLSDFFIDEKVDRFTKDKTWLLCSGSDIIWVTGLRIDNRFRLTDNTKTVYLARLLNRNLS